MKLPFPPINNKNANSENDNNCNDNSDDDSNIVGTLFCSFLRCWCYLGRRDIWIEYVFNFLRERIYGKEERKINPSVSKELVEIADFSFAKSNNFN